jgi:starch phosphorylase
LKDFDSYCEAHKRVNEWYKNEAAWAKSAMLNTACVGKFTSDRTIEEYAKEIWKLEKVKVNLPKDVI